MSDEKLPSTVDANTNDGVVSTHPQKSSHASSVLVGLILIVVLGIMLFIAINKRVRDSAGGVDEIAQLQAEADALRAAYDLQHEGAGSVVAGESLDQIVDRMKKDVDSLVALVRDRQSLLDLKSEQLVARNAEVLEGSEASKNLAAENATLKSELEQALANREDLAPVRQALAEIKSQRDALSVELADVQRRLDETLRAKNFFEGRAKQLEQDSSKGK